MFDGDITDDERNDIVCGVACPFLNLVCRLKSFGR
jgi:hypothetical protein